MSFEFFNFLNGPLKGERKLDPEQYREMFYDGEHLVLTEEFGGCIPDDLPREEQHKITWALSEGETGLIVYEQGERLLYLRAPMSVRAYSFLTKI